MSRSGYNECDGWSLIKWRGQVASAIKGKRGQAFLRELVAALDALPEKRLAANSFQVASGEVCALGSVGRARDALMSDLEPDEDGEVDRDKVADRFGIAMAMAAEIMWVNDERPYYCRDETPEDRWTRVRKWAVEQIRVTPEEAGAVEIPD